MLTSYFISITGSQCNLKKKTKPNHLCGQASKKKTNLFYNNIEIIAAFWECTSCSFFRQGHLFPVPLNSQFLLLAATVIESYL